MTQEKALAALIAKIEEGGEVYVYQDMIGALDMDMNAVARAYHGSLDAAAALHDALLPGWRWSKSALGRVSVFQERGEWFNAEGQSSTARAWLLAQLRALAATRTDTPPGAAG